ncbi:TPA: conjugal transfer protein [Vibrio parahaemolyticus]|nr:hypothetical protein FORC14_p034 [Vibrio parahaemolyticus]
MRKSLLSLYVSALVIGAIPMTTLMVSPTAYAASDADCSIWLCLPTGFPSGCNDAKSAFKQRIKKLKSPLPDFAGCLLKDAPIRGSEMSMKEGIAALMPDGRYIHDTDCKHYWDAPNDKWVWRPQGCIGTRYYVDTLMDGQPYGERFYYQR